MILLTLCILLLFGYGNCSEQSSKGSSIIGDNIVVLCVLAAFGVIAIVGACAFCFRRKKTFEKLENESGTAETVVKKNEYPIFRALATDTESSAIVPCDRNNLSRDNLLSSSDNLADDGGSSPRSDVVDSSDIVLIEKASVPSSREKSQPTTITYETEKDVKKHPSPSSSTPLLYANNVQSYQLSQTINEQMQQKSTEILIDSEDFYGESSMVEEKNDFMVINISEEAKDESSNTNPFFNSMGVSTIIESSKEIVKDELSEVESSVNDNSEKYQILEEETDGEEPKLSEEDPPILKRQNSGTSSDHNSIEEALRALDIAIGSEDDGEESEIENDAVNIEEIREEATFLVESIVNDCEKILEEKLNVSEVKVIEKTLEGPKKLHGESGVQRNLQGDLESVCDIQSVTQKLLGINEPQKNHQSVSEPLKDLQNIPQPEENLQDVPESQKVHQNDSEPLKDQDTEVSLDNLHGTPEPINTLHKLPNPPTDLPEPPKTPQDTPEKLPILSNPHDTPKNDESFEEFESIACNNMSTPCAPVKTKKVGDIDAAKALFPGGIDLSDIIEESFAADKTYAVNDKTYINEACGVNDKTFDAPIANKTFDAPKASDKTYDTPTIKIDKDENGSEDLTTVTPVNTPIELSYSSDTWDKMTYSKPEETAAETGITFNQDGWYLHPKTKSDNDTFDICDDDEADEGNMEDMSSTYDQLRRQLTEMLPHATGMSTHNDFLDDDDLKDSSSPSENYGIKYGDLDEATNAAVINPEPANEMHINYKRPLSPIMEESEGDETCRTFVLNETKLLDSTSTGMMESASAEAQMGQMPKALMASNDTLFNFEDTLSDQTDNLLMSPRIHTAGSSGSSTLSKQDIDKISLERTPTNEEPPKIDAIVRNSIKQHPLNLDLAAVPSTSKYEVTVSKMSLEDGSWPLELPEAQQIINDLSSPEQNRTADSLSFEQDVTYTIDDQKTCVSFVLKNDDERISEISEPLFASDMVDDDDDRAESLQIDDILSLDADDNFNYELNDENGNQDCDTKEMELTLNVQEASSVFENDSINPDGDASLKREFEADSLEPEGKIIDEIDADSIPTSQTATKSVYSSDSINTLSNNKDTVQSETTIVDSEGSDGNDKKKGSTDIRQVSCNQDIMATSFVKEWSDDDSSHSSEEFMYVKGGVETVEGRSDDEGDKEEEAEKNDGQKSENQTNSDDVERFDEDVDKESGAWKKHKDQIPPTPIFHGDEPQITNESEDESAEEGEFIPSYWDQSLQPKRSSLKSPEKEKAPEEKKPRRVAFKIQRYHSVYEYPCEIAQISPAYSEPQLWSNYMDDFSGNIDYFTYANQLPDESTSDGFHISSSSRPFHSTAAAQSHNTWPNDATDFSWSQIQDMNDSAESTKPSSFPLKIEWPTRRNFGFDDDDSDERPDSGVGESSDLLTDSPLMGELCHTKSSLRLPLELVSSTSSEVSDFMSDHGITKEQDTITIEITNDDESPKQPKSLLDIDDDESDKMILPTPSCTGSMDSLSSNSGSSSSERGPPSFTTFGKENVTKDSEVSGKTSIIFIEDDVEPSHVDLQKKDIKLKLTVGSSDDDSGFENISRKIIK